MSSSNASALLIFNFRNLANLKLKFRLRSQQLRMTRKKKGNEIKKEDNIICMETDNNLEDSKSTSFMPELYVKSFILVHV